MARPGKPRTIRSELIDARAALTAAGYRDGWLDAEVLLAHILSVDRAFLHGHPERPLTAPERQRFHRLIARRRQHEPIAYLTGRREFYGHTLQVTPAVLIPRPETELLVEVALDWLGGHPAARRVIDLGTGSGAIAIAIAKAVPRVRVTAIDIAAAAVALAQRNVAAQRVASRVTVRRANLLAGAAPADLIVANLPYLSEARRRSADPELDYEPEVALASGADGLDAIRRALPQASTVIRPGGCLIFECDPPQARRIERMAQRTWPAARVTIHRDLAGHNRAVKIELP